MPLCEVCNPARYDDPEWIKHHEALEAYSVDKHVFRHTNGGHIYRKGWEWTQCIYALDKLGMLRSGAFGLGVGAGHEPVIFYLADRIQSVTALDLYGNEQWATEGGREADAEVVTHPERWCPRKVPVSRIRFVNGSGTDLEFSDGFFAFCWSLSSIEHFGGHDAAAKAVCEMARVTRPGGIIAIATEYLLLPEYEHPEYFNREDILRYLVHASPDLQLVSDIEWDTLPPEYLTDSIVVPAGVDRIRRHVVLNDGTVQWTSIILVFRKL
jgi:SAM-dependent methyltransferase